jgi:hypothetical protein
MSRRFATVSTSCAGPSTRSELRLRDSPFYSSNLLKNGPGEPQVETIRTETIGHEFLFGRKLALPTSQAELRPVIWGELGSISFRQWIVTRLPELVVSLDCPRSPIWREPEKCNNADLSQLGVHFTGVLRQTFPGFSDAPYPDRRVLHQKRNRSPN